MKKLFRSFSFPDVVWFPKSEHSFLAFICVSFIAVMFITPYPQYAMWAGFLFAAYAAIANDSIQTIGKLEQLSVKNEIQSVQFQNP